MKIIGETKGGFIIEATETETYNLIGEWTRTHTKQLKVGDEINVAAMYGQAKKLKGMAEEVGRATNVLRGSLAALEILDPVIKGLAVEEEQA